MEKKDIVLKDRTLRSNGILLATGAEQRTNMSSTILNDTAGLKPKGWSVVDVNGCKKKVQSFLMNITGK